MYLPGQKQRRTTYNSAALIFAQESKALHTDLEERSKAEAASEKSYMQKMQRLEVDFVCAVPYFLWRAFKLSITCLTGLCFGSRAWLPKHKPVRQVIDQKGHPCIDAGRGASSACFSLSSKLVKELQPEKALYKI